MAGRHAAEVHPDSAKDIMTMLEALVFWAAAWVVLACVVSAGVALLVLLAWMGK